MKQNPNPKEKRPRPTRERDEAPADGIIEGRNAVIEALRAGTNIDKIFIMKGEVDTALGHIASTARAAGVVVVDAGDEDIELVNPEVVEVSEETQTGLEGCLSLPGKYGIVTRPEHVVVRAQDRNGDWYEYEGDEILARCFLHEIDHLDGHMYTEIAEKMLTPEELAALEQQEADNEEDEG